MRILLDTHIFLWCTMDDPQLSKKARAMILNAQEVYVSSASIWEASIKQSLGKLEVSIDKLVSEIAQSGFLELPITTAHAAYVGQLPHLHRDPFDRILIAQTICEPLRLLTVDAALKQYTGLVEDVS